jgi:secreted PhoX family phosphatase
MPPTRAPTTPWARSSAGRKTATSTAPTFAWNHLVLAGDPANERPEAKGNIKGDAFACPDGLAFDPRGVLWIQTDMSTTADGQGRVARLGNNQMLACDPAPGEVRRFLTGPVGCEITGVTWTPDGRTMFVNIQHPGETPSDRSDPAEPRRWFQLARLQPPDGRPRSAARPWRSSPRQRPNWRPKPCWPSPMASTSTR